MDAISVAIALAPEPCKDSVENTIYQAYISSPTFLLQSCLYPPSTRKGKPLAKSPKETRHQIRALKTEQPSGRLSKAALPSPNVSHKSGMPSERFQYTKEIDTPGRPFGITHITIPDVDELDCVDRILEKACHPWSWVMDPKDPDIRYRRK
jgi:hypothetical protein